jgi:Protein of unknown function (DUF732)
MFTSITSHAGALVTAIVVLTGGAVLGGGPAAADPQDDQFLALLDQQEIPALDNAESLIAVAHRVCGKLDGGMPVDALVDAMRNNAYDQDPRARLFPHRITRTMTRFITAAVEAYCPYDQSKIASIEANPAPLPNERMYGVAAYTHTAVNSKSVLRERLPALGTINMLAAWQEPMGTRGVVMDDGVVVAGRYGDGRLDCHARGTVLASLIGPVPSGETSAPDPSQIPEPPPPTAQNLTPPRPIAAPPPAAKQAPPPPKQPPPPPEQAEPPAVAPPPGGPPGGDTGGNGGAGPAEPSPAPPMPPGRVRLAP